MSILWSLLHFFILIVAVITADDESMEWSNHPSECPTWYLPAGTNTSDCICGDTLGDKVKCLQGERVSMLVGSCMTDTNEQLLLGSCPYVPSDQNLINAVYISVPKVVSDVNEFMCRSLNRTGLLCSQCQEGLSLAAMSYRRECVECSNPGWGIAYFLVLTFVPTTLFFLIVMACRIDLSSGPMNAPLIVIQIVLAKINDNPTLYIFKSHNPLSYYPVMISVTFYGIWNLDFLRYVIPPFCISRSLTSLQAGALEYVVAVYPLLLIVVTYIYVEMYDRKYRIVTTLWAPFKKILSSKIIKDLNIRHLLIKSFATFFILSYAKIFNVSRALLNYNSISNSTGDVVKTALPIDASTSYSSLTHIPYIVLASIMLLVFNLLPLFLLLLYPMKCFQFFLGKFPGVNWHPLRSFMDIFQGCYKNGAEGTRDYRYFAAFNLLFRIAILTIPVDDQGYSITRIVVILIVFIALLAFARPYQRNILNISEIFLYNLFLLVNICILSALFTSKHYSLDMVYVIHIFSFFYVCFICLAKVVKTLSPRCYVACAEKVARLADKTSFPCCCYQHETNAPDYMGRENMNLSASHEMDEEYPDRVNNPQDYEPLLGQRDREVAGDGSNYGSVAIQ